MVWCEVPDEVEDEFNRWYNEEHSRSGCPSPVS